MFLHQIAARISSKSLYTDTYYYDKSFSCRSKDLQFYRDAVGQAGSTVLEYGIGTGRMALALASDGYSVVGVDNSLDMLSTLRQRVAEQPPYIRERISWHYGDARDYELDRQFSAVLFPFNGLAHQHTYYDLDRFFTKVRRHIAPGGVFAFDVLLPLPKYMAGATYEEPRFWHEGLGKYCNCIKTTEYDPISQIMKLTTELCPIDGSDSNILVTDIRQFFPEETNLMLRHHGFNVIERNLNLVDSIGYICKLSV